MAVQLSTLARAFEDEVVEIESAFLRHSTTTMVACSVMPYYPMDDGCLVSLWDAWNRFMRGLFLGCASGPAVGGSGIVYSPKTIRDESTAIADLRSLARQRGNKIRAGGGEPNWYQDSAAPDIASALDLANVVQITSAVMATVVTLGGSIVVSNPLNEIQRCRNFVAHKSGRKANDLRREMAATVNDLGAHMRERTTGGAPRFSDWCDGLAAIAWATIN